MEIKLIKSTKEKINICKSIIDKLPEWFDEQGRKDYVAGVGSTLMWASFSGNVPVGFISIKSNNEFTSEVFVLGVLEKHQRGGVGSELLETACSELLAGNVKLLAVKTLAESADYELYDRSREFYLKHDFVPIDVYEKIWDEDNPCLVMVKVLRN